MDIATRKPNAKVEDEDSGRVCQRSSRDPCEATFTPPPPHEIFITTVSHEALDTSLSAITNLTSSEGHLNCSLGDVSFCLSVSSETSPCIEVDVHPVTSSDEEDPKTPKKQCAKRRQSAHGPRGRKTIQRWASMPLSYERTKIRPEADLPRIPRRRRSNTTDNDTSSVATPRLPARQTSSNSLRRL